MPPARPLARPLPVALAAALAATAAPAQRPDTLAPSHHRLAGRVTDERGAPRAGALVALLETTDTARTTRDGRFVLRTTFTGPATLVVRALGMLPAARDVELPRDADSTLALVLRRAPAAIVPVRVVAAGEYTIAEGVTGALSPLEVARTPGTAATVARAVQTLPGVQNVDEGTGLFVRGGDLLETRVLVDDAWLPAPFRGDNPAGNAGATINPFLLERVTFAAGGFGAGYGNALSGLVRLDLADRPARRGGALTATIGSLGAAAALPLARTVGVRVAASANDLAPLFRVWGEAQPFAPAPHGGDASATVEWGYRPGGRVRAFALAQRGAFGVGAPQGVGVPLYAADTRTTLALVSWRDSAGPLHPAVTIAHAGYVRDEGAGAFALRSDYDIAQLVARLGWQATPTTRVTGGVEAERLVARFDGRVPLSPLARDPGAPTAPVAVRAPSDRDGVFGEVAWHGPAGLVAVAGVRADRATLTARTTVDPRLSLAWVRGALTLTLAAGDYAQLPDPALLRPVPGDAPPAPMRARTLVAGVQLGGDALAVRAEAYAKDYRDLHLLDRERRPVAGGTGRVRGADVMVRWRRGETWSGRVAWSLVDALRTDPDTRIVAPAPTDVASSLFALVERRVGTLQFTAAVRWATGRPFTDVVGTVAGPGGAPLPVWGAPNAARFPAQRRIDLGVDWFRPIGGRRSVVLFAQLSNLLDRTNVVAWEWRDDWSRREARRAPFNRSLFAGVTLNF